MPSAEHSRMPDRRPDGAGQKIRLKKRKPQQRKREGDTRSKIRQGCSVRSAVADRDPSRLGQLDVVIGCSGRAKFPSTARAHDWSGPFGRNSHSDKSASATTRQSCSRKPVRGTSRRNDSGAIALKRTIATSRCNDNRNEYPSTLTTRPAPTTITKTCDYAMRYPYELAPMETALA